MFALRLGLLLCAGLLVLAAAPAERGAPPDPYAEGTPLADTLRYSVRAGEALIVALPPRVGGAEATYEVLEAPALSWLVDRSFMWRTLARERGTLPVRFLRRAQGAAPDTLVLLVEIVA